MAVTCCGLLVFNLSRGRHDLPRNRNRPFARFHHRQHGAPMSRALLQLQRDFEESEGDGTSSSAADRTLDDDIVQAGLRARLDAVAVAKEHVCNLRRLSDQAPPARSNPATAPLDAHRPKRARRPRRLAALSLSLSLSQAWLQVSTRLTHTHARTHTLTHTHTHTLTCP